MTRIMVPALLYKYYVEVAQEDFKVRLVINSAP